MQDIKPAIQSVEAGNRRLERAKKLFKNAGRDDVVTCLNNVTAYLERVVKYAKEERNVNL